jgi:hypothetical protein
MREMRARMASGRDAGPVVVGLESKNSGGTTIYAK